VPDRPAAKTATKTAAEPAGIQIRIEASGFPGRECSPSPDVPAGYRNIHVGVQRRDRPGELLGLHPGDAPGAAWVLEATATPSTATPGAAGLDLRGPHIQGRPGGRFIYLSWGTVDDDAGTFTMFRRAKLMLNAVDPATLNAARRSGQLTGRLQLTDGRGHPLCAAVRPPWITWSASPAG
jgi:uncharacterized protein DUF5990